MVMSSNATPATASWSRSCSLKFTSACEDGKRVRLLTPPCVTRWSGGAVVHDRGALLRRGLRRRKTTHHVVELGSQHYRGQFNVVPGTVFFCGRRRRASSCALSIAGGDVLSTRSTGIVSFLWCWWWWCNCCRVGAARRRLHCTARSSAACLPHDRSGCFNATPSASATAAALAPPPRSCDCLLQPHLRLGDP